MVKGSALAESTVADAKMKRLERKIQHSIFNLGQLLRWRSNECSMLNVGG
jgi:hypothetical protein